MIMPLSFVAYVMGKEVKRNNYSQDWKEDALISLQMA